MVDLQDLRNEIDSIDRQMTELFEKRMEISRKVAKYKISTGKKVFDKEREKKVIEKAKDMTHNDFNRHGIEELFQQTKALEWEMLIPPDGKFTVTGTSVKSVLHSVPACQKIVKKAIVDRLSEAYGISEFPETGAEYTVKATLLKDRVTLTVDTSGAGLHKRGYRIKDVAAPIKETLAAAMVQLSFWKEGRILVDPCCGSGTIPIEAALIGRNIAPGLNRSFACEDWEFIDKNLWKEEKRAAFQAIRYDEKLDITGMDIDPKAVAAAKQNAEEAGVEDCIHFRRADAAKLHVQGQNGILITYPPDPEDLRRTEKLFAESTGLVTFSGDDG